MCPRCHFQSVEAFLLIGHLIYFIATTWAVLEIKTLTFFFFLFWPLAKVDGSETKWVGVLEC